MARVSVVVPIYNVERYLRECLTSIATQTLRDLEVIMVDDGSTDASPVIARGFATQDPRFTLVHQDNAGLGAARNTGIEHATGEFLVFADSDDVVPVDAYRLMLESLDATGSDFASGGVRRIEHGRIKPAPYAAEAFATTRLRTHVTEFPALLADRTAWNTLWRRSFWDAQTLRFPVGVWHEDIPVKLPAHLHATAVDVLADPVYRWRLREGDQTSITQQRLTLKALNERLDAVEHVYRLLVDEAPGDLAEAYRRLLIRDDLRLHLDVLHHADPEYQAVFVERAGRLIADAPAAIYDGLPEADRQAWELVRQGRRDELIALLRAQRRTVSPRARAMLRRIPQPIRRAVPRSLVRRIVRGAGR